MNILIIDDEPGILRHLKKVLLSIDANFYIEACINAIEAQQKILDKHFDTIITDINLPVMSGLDFIAWLRNNGYNTAVIILSGYSDFEYARKAIRYDVSHYILKPINVKELQELLEEIEQNSKRHFLEEEERKIRQAVARLPQSKQVYSVESSSKLLILILGNLGGFPNIWSNIEDSRIQKLREEGLENNFSQLILENESLWLINSPHETFTLILSFPATTTEFRLQEFKRQVSSYAHTVSGLNIVVSDKLTSLEEVSSCQEQLLKILQNYACLSGSVHLMPLKPEAITETLKSRESLALIKNLYKDYWLQVSNLKFGDLDDTWKRIIASWQKLQLSQLQTEECLFEFANAARSLNLATDKINNLRIVYKALKEVLSTSASWQEYTHNSLEILQNFIADYYDGKLKQDDFHKTTATRVKDYICKHYKEGLNNSYLAEIFGYTPSYLSSIFSSYHKCSPSEYLNQLRIEHAKALIESDINLLNSDIAAQLGFSDASYFSKVFKKIVGQSPSHYRQSLMQGPTHPTSKHS